MHIKQKFLLFFSFLPFISGVSFALFSDVEQHQYEDDIIHLASLWIVQWYLWGTFKPDQSLTRAELLKIVMTANITPLTSRDASCFSDVEGHWARDFICTAKELNIIKGYDDNSFKPDQPVIIVEGLKIALEGFGITIDTEVYGAPWYEHYLGFAHSNNLVSRYAIFPEWPLSRGMMASIVNRMLLHGEKSWSGNRENSSLGCGTSKPSLPPTSLQVWEQTRSILTQVGSQYSQNIPAKLIVAFHWRTNTNTQVAGYYDVDSARDAIIVYPLWLPEEGPSRSRQDGGDKTSQLRDYQLFDTIVEEIWKHYCIDQDQIFVVGHSLGGWFTNMLACARGDVIRAVASVGSSPMKFPLCSGPTAAIIMHNPKDNLASFAWGVQSRDYLLQLNQCGPETVEYSWPEWANCVKYINCISDAPVVWCPYTTASDTPHMRPRFAGDMIVKFFDTLLK